MALLENGNGEVTVCSVLTSAARDARAWKRCELIPHADVLFVNKHYAQVNSPNYATTPRAFLLSLTSIAPPHALLVAYWGSEGAAVLSLPTKEYFQSSGWVEERPPPDHKVPTAPAPRGRERELGADTDGEGGGDAHSVRSGSEFWAGRQSRSPSSSAFTAGGSNYTLNASALGLSSGRSQSRPRGAEDETDSDSDGTEVPEDNDQPEVVDEVGAQDAFVAGMIYSLSRKLAPGAPYTPSSGGNAAAASSAESRGPWRLDECLRFATELSGRKARRRHWDGLAAEMSRAGWFDN